MKRPEQPSVAAKQILSDMQALVKRVDEGSDRYLIAKFIDLFIELPRNYQNAFIEHFCEAIPNERWTKAKGDDTLYLSAVRAITLHFTGLEKAGQPTLLDLNTNLVALGKSDHWSKARIIIKRPKKPFSASLKEL